MIRVSCTAVLSFRLLLDCEEEDPAIGIVKQHMKAAAMNAALDLKRQDIGYEVNLETAHWVAYEAPSDG